MYLAETAGMQTAERFLSSAEKSFGDLAEHPGMGAPLALRSPLWQDYANGPSMGLRRFDLLFAARQRRVDCARAACRVGLVGVAGAAVKAGRTRNHDLPLQLDTLGGTQGPVFIAFWMSGSGRKRVPVLSGGAGDRTFL